ncbi:MAG: hypothetical protein A2283_19100 [Lentisphaerae bacterium RIFOXYA12_FULL_48_11]|nr:MAG: hypothetical protein A2283_19100 [Lentisphaerae bacterium RIFOXYA12_FULL_48_11]
MLEQGRKTKAVGLLSGGLDSTLAARLMLEQGIEVHAINFWSPFCTCTAKSAGCPAVITAIKQLGDITLKRVAMGDEYLEMIRKPKHGYGRGMNPCIDCRIMKLKISVEYMREIGASFLFTGEVLGQRPMSQYHAAFDIIDRKSGLGGLILRPLSAAYLKPTVPEQKGWVDRTKLLNIEGRSRKKQISLASGMGINDYPCPAGGCLLADCIFGERVRDYFARVEKPSINDIPLLKTGRHRKMPNGDIVITARDENEGNTLLKIARPSDHLLVPDFPGPVVVLQGIDVIGSIRILLEYTKKDVPQNATVKHVFNGNNEIYYISNFTGVPREIARRDS